jgi:acyl transferase domain-containing protein
VAIIGLATLVPGAQLPDALWRHLLDKTSAITEIPADRWDARVLYDADGHARDRMNSKWGGFFDDVPFDPVANRMPPAVLPQICSHQLLALEVTRWAIADAGYQSRSFDRDTTAVIVGVAETGGLTGNGLITRTMMPFVLNQIPEDALDRLPEWTGESFTGMLGNVTAGRIANQLDLGGANFCLDAACATSLLTLDLAAREIREGRASMAIAATVDTLQTPFGYMAFAKTQALSPTGEARVFDTSADGIVSSEGVAVAILKTVAAARRDGDHIYAVLRGQGASADGRGLGLTAPAPAGQRRAIARALADADVDITTIDMYEAHGTGTSLGDRTEIDTLTGVLREAGAPPRSCAVGSAKSLLGHTKAAAGLVGVIKATFALRHRTLPPHAGVTSPLPALADPTSPLALYDRPRPWFAPKGHPRRAGVNAFGFGGTNGSVVLEAVDDTAPAGAALWPAELFLFGGVDTRALDAALTHVHDALTAGAEPRLRDLAAALAARVEEVPAGPRVAIVANSREVLLTSLVDALRAVRAADTAAVTLPPHMQYVQQAAPTGAVACVFPGQGAQTPHMALDHTLYFDDVRAAVELADDVCSSVGSSGGSASLAQRMFPPAAFTPADIEAERAAINATEYAQPAIGAISTGLFDLLGRLGVSSSMAAGHSYGELTALHASGALSRRDLFHLSAVRGRAMAACCGTGGMLALQCSRERALTLMAGVDGVSMANHNGPEQVVASGTEAGIAEVRRRATDAGVRAIPLPVAGAFHSSLMAAASTPWSEALEHTTFTAPHQTVYSNVTAAPYGTEPAAMRQALHTQLQHPWSLRPRSTACIRTVRACSSRWARARFSRGWSVPF